MQVIGQVWEVWAYTPEGRVLYHARVNGREEADDVAGRWIASPRVHRVSVARAR